MISREEFEKLYPDITREEYISSDEFDMDNTLTDPFKFWNLEKRK